VESNFNHSSKVQKMLHSNNQLGHMVAATASGSSNSYRFAKRVSNSKLRASYCSIDAAHCCHLDSCIGAAAFLFLLRRRNSRLMLLFSCPSIVASVKIQKNEVLCVIPSFPPPTLLLFYFLIPNSVSAYM